MTKEEHKKWKDHFMGKTIGDFINDNTKILTEFKDDYDVKSQEIRDVMLYADNSYLVMADYLSGLVLCFEVCYIGQEQTIELKALFYVYDLMDVSLNGKRGLVTAVGHEASNQYWFDDNEYNSAGIR